MAPYTFGNTPVKQKKGPKDHHHRSQKSELLASMGPKTRHRVGSASPQSICTIPATTQSIVAVKQESPMKLKAKRDAKGGQLVQPEGADGAFLFISGITFVVNSSSKILSPSRTVTLRLLTHIPIHVNISTRQNKISSTYSRNSAIRHFDPCSTAPKPRISWKFKKFVSTTSKNSFFKHTPKLPPSVERRIILKRSWRMLAYS